jgi:AraC family transcriptional regulator of adaptative response/methylated-DNA-[protein]-cysteine methyltransferase
MTIALMTPTRPAPRQAKPLDAPVPAPVDDATAWSAVLARDAAYDGRFVYAVRTTGVFCRPTCPSRRPNRENVQFFSTTESAERAGFRACRRCRPKSALPSALMQRVELAREYLDERVAATTEARVTLDELARAVGASPFHLQRTFKRVTGMTPAAYLRARRSERLKAELRRGETVSRATYSAGFGSSSRVYELADAQLGMTPAAYRDGGRGVRIHYAITPSPFGQLLVAATERGICAVALGDRAKALVRELEAEYPKATIEPATSGESDFAAWVAAIVRHLEGTALHLDVPLDLRATAFQHRVWRALREIPYGETRSYSEIARAIGAPRAVRAVASACANNRVAVVIPCHRAIRADGAPAGYRWGLDRKRRILAQEHAVADRGAPTRPQARSPHQGE